MVVLFSIPDLLMSILYCLLAIITSSMISLFSSLFIYWEIYICLINLKGRFIHLKHV